MLAAGAILVTARRARTPAGDAEAAFYGIAVGHGRMFSWQALGRGPGWHRSGMLTRPAGTSHSAGAPAACEPLPPVTFGPPVPVVEHCRAPGSSRDG